MEVLAGGKAFAQTGEWLPQATLDVFREYLIGIKGPLTTPVGGGIRSLNVALRQTPRPLCMPAPGTLVQGSRFPIERTAKSKHAHFPRKHGRHLCRHRMEQGTPEAQKFYTFLHDEMGVSKVRFPETSSFGVKPVSAEGSKRLVRSAIRYALQHHQTSVTLVHKGNIMKFYRRRVQTLGI